MSVTLNTEQLQAIEEAPDNMQVAMDDLKGKILHLLEICPYLTRSMIQVGLGPGLSPKFWDPILKGLVESRELKCEEINTTNQGGRSLNKTIYHLPKFPYPPITSESMVVALG